MTNLISKGWRLPTASQRLGVNNLGQIVSLTSNDHNEIMQSIGIILMTVPGERVMRPDFGCRIHELLFAPNNTKTAVQAERFVSEALSRWEPRIVVNAVSAQPAHSMSNGEGVRPAQLDHLNQEATMLITIAYTLKATDRQETVRFPFYLVPGEQTAVG